MKFQKGSRVEVMNKTELPTSWCVAQVVSRKRHIYNLKYDCFPGVEKVSRDFIRPCPPRAQHELQTWVAGDIVEVFNDNSWRTATICSVFDGGHFSLRPHGFTYEIIVQESNIRARLSWQHGQWLPIVKISGSYGELNCHAKLGLKIPIPNDQICQDNDNCLIFNNDVGLQESHGISLKRASPFCSSYLKASPKYGKKLKAHEMVDAFACLEDRRIGASFSNNNVNGFYELEKERTPEHKDFANDQCSVVGSCTIFNNGSDKWSRTPYVAISNDTKCFSTSRDDQDGNYSPSPEVGVAENIHKLELNAYRSTLEALYAFGPLSWDKEELLTNLRINLHISNDEHLIELRNLISVGVSILN